MAKIVYGSGSDLDNARKSLGSGYQFIDVSKGGNFNAGENDIVVGGSAVTGNVTNNGATHLWGQNRNETANAINSYASSLSQQTPQSPQAPTFDSSAMQNQINQMYQNQMNAERERLKRAQEEKALSLNQRRGDVDLNYNQGINRINNSMGDTKQNYQEARNSQGAVNNQNVMRLREAMANMGLGSSGTNAQNLTSLANQHMGNLNALTKQENQTLDDLTLQGNEMSAQRAKSLTDIDEQIDQLKRHGISEENELLQRLEAQKNNQLVELMKYGDERALQLYGMSMSQYNSDRNFNYQKDRDKVADDRYNQQWDYNVGRDNVLDNRWNTEFDYRKQRDTVGDNQWQSTFDRQGMQWDKQFNADQAYRNQQMALSRARAASGGSQKKSNSNTDFNNKYYKSENQKSIYDYAMSKKTLPEKLQVLSGYANDRYASHEDKTFAKLMEQALLNGRWYEGR